MAENIGDPNWERDESCYGHVGERMDSWCFVSEGTQWGRWREGSNMVKATGWGQHCGGGVVAHQRDQGSVCPGWEGGGRGDGLLPEWQHCSVGLYRRDRDIHDWFTMQTLDKLKQHVEPRLLLEEKMENLLIKSQSERVLQGLCGEPTGRVGARTGWWSCWGLVLVVCELGRMLVSKEQSCIY